MQLRWLSVAIVLLPVAAMAQTAPEIDAADARARQQGGLWLYESGKFEMEAAAGREREAAKDKYWADYVKGLSPPPAPDPAK